MFWRLFILVSLFVSDAIAKKWHISSFLGAANDSLIATGYEM